MNIICYHLQMLLQRRHIHILAEIFVRLAFFVGYYMPVAQVSMRKYPGKIIVINTITSSLGNKCYDSLSILVLSGGDNTSYPFDKGKVSAGNLLLKFDLKLHIFADPGKKCG